MLTIYGASDDLIEIEGDIRDEFSAYDLPDSAIIVCSDGAAFRVRYDDDGCWRFTPIGAMRPGWTKTEATGPDADYSDRLECAHSIAWVALPRNAMFARSHKEEDSHDA